LQMVTADGELVEISRGSDGDQFCGTVVALGALGFVTSVTLDVVPAFGMRQWVYDDLPGTALDDHVEEILDSAYSVSLFTDWRGSAINQVWLKHRLDGLDLPEPPTCWLGASLAGEPRHPVAGMPTENCTEQLGVPGPWHERLPHFRLEFTPSSGDELQSEYLLAMTSASAAWRAVDAVRDVVHPELHVSELRAVAADEMWLSLTGGVPSVAFHFTWRPGPGVAAAVAALEEQLAPYDARPHWGKVFSTTPERLEVLYPRLADFRRLVRDLDPAGTFGNDLVDGWIGVGAGH